MPVVKTLLNNENQFLVEIYLRKLRKRLRLEIKFKLRIKTRKIKRIALTIRTRIRILRTIKIRIVKKNLKLVLTMSMILSRKPKQILNLKEKNPEHKNLEKMKT